jgi:hypothetical protein
VSALLTSDWRERGVIPRGRAPSCFVCVDGVEVDPSAYSLLLGYYLGDGRISGARRTYDEALDLLEIPWRQSNWKTFSVSTRAGVARLDELAGPKC